MDDLPGRPICHCRTKPIGPHWHDSRQYGCPMQPVPAQRPYHQLTEQEGGPPNERYPDPTAVELERRVLAKVQECHHGNPDDCDLCTAEAYARNACREVCDHSGPVCCEVAAIDEVVCPHGHPGFCDMCEDMAYARNERDPDLDGSAAFLDASDPFERVLIDIVRTNRAKRRDYALDGSPFSNFDTAAAGLGMEGFGALEAVVYMIHNKLARLQSMRANGRLDDPANESVTDTYLDLAVFGVIALAIHRYPEGKIPWETS